MTFTTFTDGNVLTATQLNNNFEVTSRHLFQDTNIYTVGPVGTSTLLTSTTIASSVPKNGIKVTTVFKAKSKNLQNFTGTLYFVVGGVIRRTAQVTWTGLADNAEVYNTAIFIDNTSNFDSDISLAFYGTTGTVEWERLSLVEYTIETI